MNERDSLINLLTSWIKKSIEQGNAGSIYITGSILREPEFRDESDIDLIVTGTSVDLERIKNSLKFVKLVTQRSIDITLIDNEYIDNFSLLYKSANVIEGFCFEQPEAPLATQLRSLPYFKLHLQRFWYAHLLLRRLALQAREPVESSLFKRRLEKYISWLNNRLSQNSILLASSPGEIAKQALNILRHEREEVLSLPSTSLKKPLEKYLHIAYWNNNHQFENVSSTHEFVQKVSILSEELFTQFLS